MMDTFDDRWGQRPRFLASGVSGALATFSLAEAAVDAGGVELDRAAVAERMTARFLPPPYSGLRGVERLAPDPPADDWDPALSDELRLLSTKDLARRLRHSLEKSVSEALNDAESVAVALSSGVDSAVLAALVSRTDPSVPLITLASAGSTDEAPDAQRLAMHLGSPHVAVTVSDHDLQECLVPLVRESGLPFAHGSPIGALVIGRACRELGVTRLISGDGADRLLRSYETESRVGSGGRPDERRPSGRELRLAMRWPPFTTDGGQSPMLDESLEVNFARLLDEMTRQRRPDSRAAALRLLGLRDVLPELLSRKRTGLALAGLSAQFAYLSPGPARFCLHAPVRSGAIDSRKSLVQAVAHEQWLDGLVNGRKAGMRVDIEQAMARLARPEFALEGTLGALGLLPERVRSSADYIPLVVWTTEIWLRQLLNDDPDGELHEQLWRKP